VASTTKVQTYWIVNDNSKYCHNLERESSSVIYNCSKGYAARGTIYYTFIVQALLTIVIYDGNMFIVQATGFHLNRPFLPGSRPQNFLGG